MNRLLWLAPVLLAGRAFAQPQPVTVVAFLPQVDFLADTTQDIVAGIQLAADLHPSLAVTVQQADEWSDFSFDTVLGDATVAGVIGPLLSGDAAFLIPLLSGELAMISPTNAHPLLTSPPLGDEYARVCPTEAVEGANGAGLLAQIAPHSRVLVLHDGDPDYGQILADAFVARAPAAGLSVTSEMAVALTPGSHASDVVFFRLPPTASFGNGIVPQPIYGQLQTLLRQGAPEAVYLGADFQTAASTIAALRKAGFSGPIVGADRFGHCHCPLDVDLGVPFFFTSTAGAAAEGVYSTSRTLDPAALADPGFASAFAARFGHGPGDFAAYAYAATDILLGAVESAGGPAFRQAVIAAVKGAGRSAGPIGRFHIGASGDTDSTLGAAWQVQQGNFVRLPLAVGSPGN